MSPSLGTYTNRTRLPLAIVERIRAAVDPKFIIMFRLSMLDLVEGGSEWPEVVALAQGLEAAGADISTRASGGTRRGMLCMLIAC